MFLSIGVVIVVFVVCFFYTCTMGWLFQLLCHCLFFYENVIYFAVSDDFIVENVNLSKKMSLSFLLLLLLLKNKGHLGCN